MLRAWFRSARVACVVLIIAIPSFCTADEPGFGKVQDGDQLRGCGITIGYTGGQRCILTAAHCLRGDIRFDGYPATVLAKDESMDIALLYADMPAPKCFPIVAPKGVNSGAGTRYGFPDYKYTEDACGINSDGTLTVQAIPGASGGPIISKDGFVVGIVTHTTKGVPAHKIRAFLDANSCSWLLKPAVVHQPSVKDIDPTLADLEQAIADFAKEVERNRIQQERFYRMLHDDQERMYRELMKKRSYLPELDD